MAHTRSFQQILGLSGMIFVVAVSLMACSIREGMACPQYCLDVAYTTCTSSGDQHLRSYCNCCLVPNGHNCTLHLTDGSHRSC
ncbi:uncharacterized protein LOC131048718 [Cryptomeria japonica]|uniref:uncharacterized protein LOC131048718 n=1 Tax=Cryptomeria japonica TaxID=3369 RepID=UPI0025ACC0D3|nr:uncharacterized protein LOC131048718 [Cryptomeria japonica]